VLITLGKGRRRQKGQNGRRNQKSAHNIVQPEMPLLQRARAGFGSAILFPS
jgi:hypothetical protein